MVMAASLEEDYRYAFKDFSRKAERVQFLAQHPTGDQKAFETALLELEKAHLAYNDARDTLVQSLQPTLAPQTPSHRPDGCRDAQRGQHLSADVQAIAELLWESAGRPTGTAEEDWRRAEAIVQRAAAAMACG